MRVALVNPNRYLETPVIPIGLEYVAGYVEAAGHEPAVIDLAFSPDPEGELRERLGALGPGLVGFTFRNLDTSLYYNMVGFLGELARFVSVARESCGAPVVIGGTGLLTGLREVAERCDCDWAVQGPGEKSLPWLIGRLERGDRPARLIDGWQHGFDRDAVPRRARWVDYAPYLERGGVVGFATQAGCYESCIYCLEARTPWKARSPRAVVEELRGLAEQGYRDLHLCDTEFNQDPDTAKLLLAEMASAGLGLRWALYLKPLPHDEAVFRLLAETGAHLVTLSVDTHSLARGRYRAADLASFIRLAQRHGVKVAVDLLLGFPGEGPADARRIIDFFRGVRPESVGVNPWLRLYKYTELTSMVRGNPPRGARLEGDDPDCIDPVFLNCLAPEDIVELFEGDGLFRLEGQDRLTNYQRLREEEKQGYK